MKGSIFFMPDRGRWAVSWYHKEPGQKKGKYYTITRYQGQFMPCTHYQMKRGKVRLDEKGRAIPDKSRCQGYAIAGKLRALMQGRWEQHQKGILQFRMDEFTGKGWTDVLEFYETWMKEKVEQECKIATIKGYWSYYHNWISPYFNKHPIRLHEIKSDMLLSLLNFIKTGLKKKNPNGNYGKTARNIMGAFRTCLEFAEECDRIPKIPTFPKKKSYNLKKKPIEWLTDEEYWKVIEKIPKINCPPFLWLYYHFRRPGEACVLKKSDYDMVNDAFWVQRALSARVETNSTKTGEVFLVPCDPDFKSITKRLINENPKTPYLFVNPRARKKGKRYSLESLRNIWYAACDKAEIKRIWVYKGMKHTSCTNYLNKGGTVGDLEMITGQTKESLKKYAEITLQRKRRAMSKGRENILDIRELHQKNVGVL
ncbi:tyrosine-type recombinase/integrase [Desulfobacula toluolica]|uniref:Integrase family protein n=1 Tax=Desulfobacula toluolica (strain DSM 7467 / Tol2) TaxID=651182 RepID=K0NID4_DESTT|nr:tyrosine-type recombinase/integrase [Desulfobacula toluolica]CCK81151.1 integrase family protein [Desulfobacula toluolica Tol2]